MRKVRFLLAVVATLPVAMLGYRIYLAWAASRLASSGAREEALFVIMMDPLWKAEFTVARMFGNPSAVAMNTIGIAAWGAIAAVTAWIVIRRLRSKAQQ
jgi:hypothetical protein